MLYETGGSLGCETGVHGQPARIVQHPLRELYDSLAQLGGWFPAESLQELSRDGVPEIMTWSGTVEVNHRVVERLANNSEIIQIIITTLK